MGKMETGVAEERLLNISTILGDWYETRESDSVRVQSARERQISTVSQRLLELTYDVKPEHRLRLEVGQNPIRAVRFEKGAYNFYHLSPAELAPGTEFVVQEAQPVRRGGQTELFVGDFGLSVAVSSLAKAIHETSQLTVVEAHAASTVSS